MARSALNGLVLPTPQNNFKPPVKSFVLRQRGAKTGIRLVHYESLRNYILANAEVGGLRCAWQRKLLYFPTTIPAGDVAQASARSGLEPWRNVAGEIIGWKLVANSASSGSVLVIHGNGGCALQRGYLAKPIHDAGALDVFILEFPGYGMRSGSPSLKSFLAAAEETFELLPKRKPIYLVSESLGTGVAAHLGKTHPTEVAGMVMLVPYDSLPSLAQNKMPMLLPYFFLVDRFEPAAWLKNYRGPIKFVLAERDEVIPVRFGQRLVDSYAGPKMLQIVPGAGHGDVGEQSPEWWQEVFSFFVNSIHPKS